MLWTVLEILRNVTSMEARPHYIHGASHILQGIEVICLEFCSAQIDDQFLKEKEQLL